MSPLPVPHLGEPTSEATALPECPGWAASTSNNTIKEGWESFRSLGFKNSQKEGNEEGRGTKIRLEGAGNRYVAHLRHCAGCLFPYLYNGRQSSLVSLGMKVTATSFLLVF